MIWIAAAFFAGVIVGIFVATLMVAAKDDDEIGFVPEDWLEAERRRRGPYDQDMGDR